MALPFFNWSKTAASNATADSTVNWAEGQAPSSLNDSARAMMASTAAYRDDVGGSLTTGGTSTAYTLTTNQVFDTLAHLHLQKISFVPHTNCGATVTLAVDGLAAKPLRSSPGVELTAGALIAGAPYTALYNNSDLAFYLYSGTVGANGAITPTSVTSSGKVTGATGVGYATGVGGTVTQATSKETGVTLNKMCGQITVNNETVLAGHIATFTVTNSQVAAGDVVILNHQSAGTPGAYMLTASNVTNGTFDINMTNVLSISDSSAPVISFAIIKAVTA